jgi:nitrous oxide reductase accessory protein NosL
MNHSPMRLSPGRNHPFRSSFIFCYLSLIVAGGMLGSGAILAGDPQGPAGRPAASISTADGACAKMGPDENGKMRISGDDRCPVCAMRPAKYPEFSCAIVLTNGCTHYFCSSGCMINAWLEPERLLNTPRTSLKYCIVRNYFSGEEIDGTTAIWIAGSDVIGPMGPAPLPVKTEEELSAFRRRHGAGLVFSLPKLDLKTWKQISGKMPLP